ncbi:MULTISPECIES: diguanylate cyclase [Alphaproteobacteria]|uniref:PAS domain-containing protein n=2 Tax=Alphaproteobacteria TaxID=28211 RepID=A0A512HN91_9HYPH|nr:MULTISPECIES: diguanylate cyclase [Alphaproteobacteria]GEO86925.1 hypothetical protein RNA01_38570 [Ciceribacter naphthalenivorans]GLR22239.1 hypothetical protein GCM10007920_20260 [Ciceribacter naphthalenivorans]GLT05095.1 hypothetical protein GCM10007926_20260 [Sphingomonas psychrolutea]
MYAVAVLDRQALATFTREHPWLEFPDDIREVSLFFDDNGCPARLSAVSVGADGADYPADTNVFSTDTILALIRFAPHGTPRSWESPEEARVWRILERLPTCDEMVLVDETLEASRRSVLDEAYEIVRKMTVDAYQGLAGSAGSPQEADRLSKAALLVPARLDDVTEETKPLFLEVDLWRLVAVVRDEASMSVDYEVPSALELDELDRLIGDPRESEGVSDSLIQTLFDLSPAAFSISTIGKNSSRYVRVNKAYLDLVGKRWEEIRGHEMVSSGLAIGNEARERRLAMLDRDGAYSGERAEIRNAKGEIIPILISARRLNLAGELYDFEVITDVSRN